MCETDLRIRVYHALGYAALINFVFTRVVNHCVTVLGTDGLRLAQPGRKGRVAESRLGPTLKVEH